MEQIFILLYLKSLAAVNQSIIMLKTERDLSEQVNDHFTKKK